jgi:AcrR family transcriptional regulator
MSREGRLVTACPSARTRSRDLEALLLEAADVVLRRDGLDGVTVRSVATEARVAAAGVYSRFGSKEGLIDALLARTIDDLQRSILSQGEPDPLERLRGTARRYRRWALMNPQHHHAIFFGHGRATATTLVHQLSGVFELGVAAHEYAIASGAIGRVNARQSCARFWCAIHGAVAFELRGLVRPEESDSQFEAVLSMVLRGLASASA